jgi:hypothetical protein
VRIKADFTALDLEASKVRQLGEQHTRRHVTCGAARATPLGRS